jgi:1-aminocyclopropane-1-carboxylate deaminase/D-cysteine desulfhydrase-like pyridoxal-dependent ACC family enzyme
MEKPTKLEEQELKQLKNFQEQSERLIAQLGQLQYKKFQLKTEEEYLKTQYSKITSEETEISSKLKTKYGNINIDLETGNITYPNL